VRGDFSLVAKKEKLTILSSTLAEIYVRQGHFEKAREVYEKLLSKDLGNDLYRSRLILLSKDSPEQRKLKVLSGLLKKIEERRDERAAIKQSA
jgi:pentatricopeptide repeat protein